MSDQNTNLPAEQKPNPQRAAVEQMMALVEARQSQIQTLLADSNVDGKRFLEVARRAFMRNPDLVKCTAQSVLESFINAANDGLLPDGRQGAIVPYNVNVAEKGKPKKYVKKAQWMPMYQGLLDVAYRSGNFKSIEARVVYEGDEYDYSLGISPEVTHKPRRRKVTDPAPAIAAAYAVAITKDGGVFFEPFEAQDIAKVRAAAKAGSGPWSQWDEEMTRKGPLRRLWKYLPKDDRMVRVGAREDAIYDLDIEAETVEEPKPRAIRAGFAPPPPPAPAALPQGTDPVVDQAVPDIQDADFTEGDHEDEAEAQAEAQADQPPPPAPEPPREDEGPTSVFRTSLEVATNWLNVKQAIRSLLKHRMLTDGEWVAAWTAYTRTDSKVEACQDPYLFRAWLELGPAAAQIESELKLLAAASDYEKAPEELKANIAARAAYFQDL